MHSIADSPVRTAAPKPGSLRVPLAVLDHLPHLHGAEFKVLLVLGRHQARGGGRDQRPFPYSIPQIMEDTGLCPRAISQAISRLDKHHLIRRVKKHGALPNYDRVLLEPAAPDGIPKEKKPVRLLRPAPPPQPIPPFPPVLARFGTVNHGLLHQTPAHENHQALNCLRWYIPDGRQSAWSCKYRHLTL